jgi:PIN domain nuclease of toxin-antitoxin system
VGLVIFFWLTEYIQNIPISSALLNILDPMLKSTLQHARKLVRRTLNALLVSLFTIFNVQLKAGIGRILLTLWIAALLSIIQLSKVVETIILFPNIFDQDNENGMPQLILFVEETTTTTTTTICCTLFHCFDTLMKITMFLWRPI